MGISLFGGYSTGYVLDRLLSKVVNVNCTEIFLSMLVIGFSIGTENSDPRKNIITTLFGFNIDNLSAALPYSI